MRRGVFSHTAAYVTPCSRPCKFRIPHSPPAKNMNSRLGLPCLWFITCVLPLAFYSFNYTRFFPASGPLHLMFPVPRIFFHWLLIWLFVILLFCLGCLLLQEPFSPLLSLFQLCLPPPLVSFITCHIVHRLTFSPSVSAPT